jgi:hypothetical protein
VGLTAKTTLVDADSILISDSADSDKAKKSSLTNLYTYLKSKFDSVYSPTTNGSVIIQTTTDNTNTGTTVDTKIVSLFVAGGTISTGQTIDLSSRIRRSGTVTLRLWTNTTDSISGATQLGIYTVAASFVPFNRHMVIKGSTSEFYPTTTSSATDEVAINASPSNVTIDHSVDRYYILSSTNGASGDSCTVSYFKISR